jgi:glycosyltransferase involved in cell wall biosynthesis
MNLSVIIIARDAESTIRRCLASVAWADEIVVVENGSGDRTAQICRELGAKLHQTDDWPGFGPQKNRALEHAASEWVLSLDADEWVSPELRAAIGAAIGDARDRVAFRMPRLSSFCGRLMRHSGWWPDYVTRLFRRGHARFSDDLIHERVLVDGPVGRLGPPLRHEAVRDLEQILAKINAYSSAGAESMLRAGRRGSLAAALVHGYWAFLRAYLLRAGFLDGREGFMLAVCDFEVTYYRYLKLMRLAGKQSTGQPRDA